MAALGYRLEDRPGKPSAWKRNDGAQAEAARRHEEAAARAAAEGAAKREKKEQTLKLKQTVRRCPVLRRTYALGSSMPTSFGIRHGARALH